MRYTVLAEYSILVALALLGIVVVEFLRSSSLAIGFFTFAAVVAASLLIAWAAEASQFSISQGLALAVVAVVQTIPEYFVEGTIAWKAGIDPTNWLPNVIANFTGANRLLTGLGWPLILFTMILQRRRNGQTGPAKIALPKEQSIEVVFLLAASLYYVLILFKGTLTIFDSLALGAVFIVYMWMLSRLPAEAENPSDVLSGSQLALVQIHSRRRKLAAIGGLFAFSALVFFTIANPFVESLQRIAIAILGSGSVFFVIQWIAPLLSEFPEKVTAFNWARKITLAPMALLNFLSSAVNELTALVALVPLLFSVSLGAIGTVPVAVHSVEILLTMSQSLYACAALLDLEYGLENAAVLFVLWLVSFVYVDSRFWVSIAFLLFAGAEAVRSRGRVKAFSAFRETLKRFS